MNNTNILRQFQIIKQTVRLLACMLLISGCEDFLKVNDPFGQIPHQEVFEDEVSATVAVSTLYGKLRDQILLTGNFSGVGFAMGLYADELDYYNMPGHALELLY